MPGKIADAVPTDAPVTDVAGEIINAAQTRSRALENLNPEQRIAVSHPPGPLLVLAGAGTGKTRVLTHRVAWLIGTGTARPEEVLAITLTNKAAREMIVRLRRLCGPVAERVHVGTFHATCARILRAHPDLVGRSSRFSIYDESDARQAITKTMLKAERATLTPKEVQREISLAKNQAMNAAQFARFSTDVASRIVARVWQVYEEELRRADALDFDDLLIGTVELLSRHQDIRAAYQEKWQAILVDEYQDTNPTQARLLRLLVDGKGRRNFMFVGDDRQVIYGFRLADLRLILEFEQEYHDASVVTLEINHRSTAQILDGANRLMRHNVEQRHLALVPDEKTPPGPDITVHGSSSETEEAQWIALQIQKAVEKGVPERQIAVLGRWVSVVERIEHALAVAGISYELVGSRRFFSHREVKRALAHLRVLCNPRDEAAFASALEIRPRVGASTIAKVIAYANRHRLTLLEAASAAHMIPGIKERQTRENVARFAYDMLAFTGKLKGTSISSLVHDVIHMPLGVADAVAKADDAEQRMGRLRTLPEAASTFERQHDNPTLEGWLQDAMLAGRDDRAGPDGQRGRVTLGTIHATKGLEFDVVFGAGMEGRILPSFWAGTRAGIEEERRIAYVLLTRSKRWAIFCYSLIRDGRQSGPSLFISEAIGGKQESTSDPPDATGEQQPANPTK